MISSFLVVDKPAGVTSHDVVAAVRAVTGVKKVGHTGTLDPFATGVLPLALGGATRMIQFLDESIKVYDATIALGSATDTGDPTGAVVRTAPVPTLDAEGVRAVLARFRGERMQEPPAYSAVKVEGKPLYHYARKGQAKRADPRPITLHEIDLVELGEASLRVLITCSRGTYARVLADEIAVELGSAGHLAALQRPRSGPFFLDDAIDLPTLAEIVAAAPGHDWRQVLLERTRGQGVPWKPREVVLESLRPWLRSPVHCLSNLPLVDVGAEEARQVRQGSATPAPPAALGATGRYLVVSGDSVVAVAERTARGPRTLKVL